MGVRNTWEAQPEADVMAQVPLLPEAVVEELEAV